MNSPSNHSSALDDLVRLAGVHRENDRPSAAARLLQQAAHQAMGADNPQQALTLIDQALALTADDRASDRFSLLFDRERLYGQQGRRAAQLRDLASLEAVAERLDDDGRRAIVAALQAEWRATGGDVGAALSLSTLAVRLAQLTGATAAAAAAQRTLGHVLISQAQFERAALHLQRAAALATELGDNALRADIMRHMGVLANDQEQFEKALLYYTQADALYAGVDDRRGRAQVLNNRGHVHAHRGQLGRALQTWQQTARLFQQLGDVPGSIRVRINLGALHIDLGQYEEAEKQLTQALAQAEEIKLVPGMCIAMLNLGLAAQRQGRHAAAAARLAQARPIARQMGAQRLEGAILTVEGHAQTGLGDLAAAGDAYWQALSIWESLNLPNLATEARAGLARIAHANNAPTLALGFVNQILAQIARDGRLEGVESPVDIFLTCYQVLDKTSDSRASAVLQQGYALLQERLDTLQDEEARAAMRQNIPSHRTLLALIADD